MKLSLILLAAMLVVLAVEFSSAQTTKPTIRPTTTTKMATTTKRTTTKKTTTRRPTTRRRTTRRPTTTKRTTTTTTTLPPCTLEDINVCEADCWANSTLSVCDTSCSCRKCFKTQKYHNLCKDLCVDFEEASGGVCGDNGKCQCSHDCARGLVDGGYCGPCCAKKCAASGKQGVCSADKVCSCIGHTPNTCKAFCNAKGESESLCTDGTCLCQGCDSDACNEKCAIDPANTHGVCDGLANNCRCVANATITCGSDKCDPLLAAHGFQKNCTVDADSSPSDPCMESVNACDGDFCDSVCNSYELGDGVCGDEDGLCKCSLNRTYPACPALLTTTTSATTTILYTTTADTPGS